MGNKFKWLGVLLLLLAAFLAGGWFFNQLPNPRSPKGEVEELYQEDGESLGIFDDIPAEDMAAAEAVASEALNLQMEPLSSALKMSEDEVPSQMVLSDLSEIVSIVAKEKEEDEQMTPQLPKAALELSLTGTETVALPSLTQQAVSEGEEETSRISLIAAPVKNFLIKNTQDYKDFKTRARGGYPEVDFNKKMLIVLESDSNLPDNIFEIVSAEIQDGKLLVSYRVNVFGLDKKTNTHAVLAVDKTELPVELKQVL